jgi:eukaryotic-like serine/threonine-protein kinase
MIEHPALAAAIADRYRLDRQLGAGGMATVYLAHDLKYSRDVAIKVLKPALAESLTAERFVREIGITARLNHPHILPMLDSGVAGGGEFLYYVMPVATGESLRDRIAHAGAMTVPNALRIAIEVTEALVSAHEIGVIHRDIKPDNVLISGGHAVVVDFGIAKAVGEARDVPALTMEGISLGTPVYMAPEQAMGEADVDGRTDIYAVGAMLWEMCAGKPPFTGAFQQIIAQKVAKAAPSLAPACPAAPSALVSLVARCLAIDPNLRPQTAAGLLNELRMIATPAPVAATRASKRAMAIAGSTAVAVLALAAVVIIRDRRARWVHDTALPEMQRLFDADKLDSAFMITAMAAERAPNDSAVARFWPNVSQTQTFLSEPAGATVSRAPLTDTSRWIPVGVTPTAAVRIPNNAWFYRYEKPGYRTVTILGARLGGSYVPIPDPVLLRKSNEPDSDMVLLSGGRLTGTLFGLTDESFALSDFLIDRLEVTNRQYQAFVAAGGYTNQRLWDSTIVRDGRVIPWGQAMALFVDKTGRPGPSTWVGGAPPADQEDLPVGGVSWYEAKAYARFVGKELPTVLEWNAAAIPDAARWVVPHGRFETTSPVRGGDPRGVSPRGVYDLAGNVREWTLNAREPGSRYILGGGWSDPTYLFSELYTQPELDRSAINGIRLIKRLGAGRDLARAEAPIPNTTTDRSKVKPVDDATFKGYLALYDYDHTPLNTKVESRDSTEADWIREEVNVDSPGGSGRLPVVMFIPKHAKPPYQAAVIWPASDALIMPDTKELPVWILDFIVRSGRAVIYPVHEGTLGRKTIGGPGVIEARDRMVRRAKDMRRAMDYALSRGDIDSTRLAYVGASWGGRIGGLAIGVEPRFRAAVLYVAGLGADPNRPEVDPVNFLPRIHVPVLMLSGKYDSVFPYEVSQKPFFELLGTPVADKKRIVYEGGHFLPRPQMVSETLAWLDHYLGAVTR